MLNDYEITKDTLAIIPIDKNKSEVIESDYKYIIDKGSTSIIDESCRFFGSSLIGRHEGTKRLIGVSYKAPIIIEESSEIIFFPTTSPRFDDCTWISLKDVDKYERNNNKTKICFKNGSSIDVNISYGSFENQILRSTRLKAVLQDRKISNL